MAAERKLKHTYSRVSKTSSFSVNTGKLLKAARKANGYSQTTVADSIVGFTQSDISRIERGKMRVYADDLLLFSRLYQKPISHFYNHGTLEA